MKEKAEVAEKYSDFNTLLLSRPRIVLGMGWRQFFRFFNKKNQYTIAIGVFLYILVLFQILLIAFLGNPKYKQYLSKTIASVIIIDKRLEILDKDKTYI